MSHWPLLIITILQQCVVYYIAYFCVSADKPVRGSTPVFEFIDPDVQVIVLFGVFSQWFYTKLSGMRP